MKLRALIAVAIGLVLAGAGARWWSGRGEGPGPAAEVPGESVPTTSQAGATAREIPDARREPPARPHEAEVRPVPSLLPPEELIDDPSRYTEPVITDYLEVLLAEVDGYSLGFVACEEVCTAGIVARGDLADEDFNQVTELLARERLHLVTAVTHPAYDEADPASLEWLVSLHPRAEVDADTRTAAHEHAVALVDRRLGEVLARVPDGEDPQAWVDRFR